MSSCRYPLSAASKVLCLQEHSKRALGIGALYLNRINIGGNSRCAPQYAFRSVGGGNDAEGRRTDKCPSSLRLVFYDMLRAPGGASCKIVLTMQFLLFC